METDNLWSVYDQTHCHTVRRDTQKVLNEFLYLANHLLTDGFVLHAHMIFVHNYNTLKLSVFSPTSFSFLF